MPEYVNSIIHIDVGILLLIRYVRMYQIEIIIIIIIRLTNRILFNFLSEL